MNKPFDPLAAVLNKQEPQSTSSSDLESSSRAINNDTHGKCPKCQTSMGLKQLPKESVFFCDRCRVSSPIPVEE